MIKKLMMNDTNLSRYYQKYRERKIDSRMQKIFNKEISEISQNDLSQFAENFTQRLYLFKNYIPQSLAYVLVGVLTHQNLHRQDKEVRKNIREKLKIF